MSYPVQKVRKRRSTSAANVLTLSSNTAKVKVKDEPEPPDEVTCSADDVRRQSAAAEVAKCESSDDALLPDTTTENDDVRDDLLVRAVTTCQSASDRIVDAVAAANRSAVTQFQQLAVPAHSVVGQAYGYGAYQHQYVNVHHAAPLHYRDEPAFLAAGREQYYYNDIDDVLSVMASVAGVTQQYHPNLSNY